MHRYCLLLTCYLWLFTVNPAVAQVERLFFPATPVRLLTHGQQSTRVQLTDQPFGVVIRYYLKKTQESEWDLLFPTVPEMAIWWQALQKSQKPPVMMLSLVNLKSKVNFNLTIGALAGTSPQHYQTIITIYESKRVFGQAP